MAYLDNLSRNLSGDTEEKDEMRDRAVGVSGETHTLYFQKASYKRHSLSQLNQPVIVQLSAQ
jgi:hypothetical protein